MTGGVAPVRLQNSKHNPISYSVPRLFVAAVLGVLATYFVVRYAGRYIEYAPSAYRQYWDVRWSLIVHIIGGVTALVIGPLQFSSRLRQRRPSLHRIMGRCYLGGVLVGAVAALYLILVHSKPAFGMSLLGLNLVWAMSAVLALIAIRNRNIQQHREWMVRSYVATYAFVSFRVLVDVPALEALGAERFTTIGWLCWTVPLFCCEIMLQWRRIIATHRV
jgi:uncharacterized membrane protein